MTVATLALASTACLPIPHREYDLADTDGIITIGDRPVAEIPVAIVTLPQPHNDTSPALACDAIARTTHATARTDSHGRFRTARVGHWALFVALLGDRWMPGWALCIQSPPTGPNAISIPPALDTVRRTSQWRLVYAEQRGQGGTTGSPVRYACDVATPWSDRWRDRGHMGQCHRLFSP